MWSVGGIDSWIILPWAISAATHCIELAPEYADGYLLLGLLQKEKGNKEEAIKNLPDLARRVSQAEKEIAALKEK